MTVRAFLADRLGRLVAMGAGAAGSAAVLWAPGTAGGVVVLLLIGWALAAGGLLVWDYLRLARRLRLLRQTLAGLDQKYLLTECVPPPMGSYERALFTLQRQAGKSMVETVSAAQAAQRDYREYVETWVHEVKTPITAARLLCRGLEGTTRRRLEGELAQIEAHVERALFYARAESPEKDLVVRPTPLAGLVRQAVQAHRTLLIQNGVRVEAEAVAGTVYTDEKWAAFLLGQLLQNAARYRRDRPVITLTAQPLGDRVALTVADNGLGIPAGGSPAPMAASEGGPPAWGCTWPGRWRKPWPSTSRRPPRWGRGACSPSPSPPRRTLQNRKEGPSQIDTTGPSFAVS